MSSRSKSVACSSRKGPMTRTTSPRFTPTRVRIRCSSCGRKQMALEGVEFGIEKGSEWDRVIAILADTNAEFTKETKEAVSRLVDPWMSQAEADVASTPIKGVGKQSGLRREVAGSVSKDV